MPKKSFAGFLLFFVIITSCTSTLFAQTVSDEWMELRHNGKKIGFAYQKTEETKNGFKLTSKMVMRLGTKDGVQDTTSSQTYFFDKNLNPTKFSYMQKMLNHRQFFDGVVSNGKVKVTVRSGGTTTHKEMVFKKGANLTDAVNLIMKKKKMKSGEHYSFTVFMVPLLTFAKMEVDVGPLVDFNFEGKKIKVFLIRSVFENFTVISYATKDGRILKEESPFGFTSYAVSEAKATAFDEPILPFTTLLAFSLIPVDEPITNQADINDIRFTISGLSKKSLLPTDERQKVTAIKAIGKGKNKTYSVNLTVKKNRPKVLPLLQAEDDNLKRYRERYTKPSIEAQSNDPSIKATAKKIIGSEKEMYKSAQLLNRWVYKNVHKKFVDTFSAVETLKTMEGECQSHTNLYAALSKSVGIPTRTVSGIVYSKEFGGFLYHAWSEVYVGEWVAIDPTFGQEVADATHIKLIEGDLSSQLKLFAYIGKIAVEVKEIK